MKTLILIRHAKSDWPPFTPDFDRPLAERGINDAHKMAEFLLNSGLKIDQFITSPALRAKTTCGIFADKYQKNYNEAPDLYHAQEKEFINVISNSDESADSVAIFSHNEGISDFASNLCGDDFQFKTCAVAIFKLNSENWSGFKKNPISLKEYITPKHLQ